MLNAYLRTYVDELVLISHRAHPWMTMNGHEMDTAHQHSLHQQQHIVEELTIAVLHLCVVKVRYKLCNSTDTSGAGADHVWVARNVTEESPVWIEDGRVRWIREGRKERRRGVRECEEEVVIGVCVR